MLLALLPVYAAEITAMPTALQAEGTLTWSGLLERGELIEAEEVVGGRQVTEHQVVIEAAFAPITGVSIVVGLDTTPSWKWSYPDSRPMVLEPVDGGGTYLGSPPDTLDPTVQGGGVNGIWLGGAVAPFSEAYDKDHRVTWKLDAAVRTGSRRSNRWTVNDTKRGGGPGGFAFRASGAFSRRTGASEPYARVRYTHNFPTTVAVADEEGLGGELVIRPASMIDILGGTEIHALSNRAFSVDVFLGGTYHSPEQVPGGLLLPRVLDGAKQIAITHSDRLTGRAGLGMHIRANEVFALGLLGHVAYTVPHRLEHPFPVTTSSNTIGGGWTVQLKARLPETKDR